MSSMIVRPPLPLVLAAVAGIGVGISSLFKWRHAKAKQLYLSQCDVALLHPRLSDPAELDMNALTLGGSKQEFERYEWYVARLVYTLDECLRLAPDGEWHAVAKTQLGAHRNYLCSDYYAKQGYAAHYSSRMRALLCQQRN